MREIKFRAWDVKRKKWVTDFSVSNEGKVMCIASCLSYGGVHETKVELVQFIGLHDRKGKEIYDVDVMLWPDGYKQVIGFNEKHTETSVRDIETSFGYHFDSQHPVEQGEVIGNFYENPELVDA